MTIISILVNKFLLLIGATDLAAAKSSSATMFGIFAIALIVCGVLTIRRKHPVFGKYPEYTPESVERASTLLGIGDIVLGVLTFLTGVVNTDAILTAVAIASGTVFVAYIVITTLANGKLVKKCKA